jgi:hypothetical protein
VRVAYPFLHETHHTSRPAMGGFCVVALGHDGSLRLAWRGADNHVKQCTRFASTGLLVETRSAPRRLKRPEHGSVSSLGAGCGSRSENRKQKHGKVSKRSQQTAPRKSFISSRMPLPSQPISFVLSYCQQWSIGVLSRKPPPTRALCQIARAVRPT